MGTGLILFLLGTMAVQATNYEPYLNCYREIKKIEPQMFSMSEDFQERSQFALGNWKDQSESFGMDMNRVPGIAGDVIETAVSIPWSKKRIFTKTRGGYVVYTQDRVYNCEIPDYDKHTTNERFPLLYSGGLVPRLNPIRDVLFKTLGGITTRCLVTDGIGATAFLYRNNAEPDGQITLGHVAQPGKVLFSEDEKVYAKELARALKAGTKEYEIGGPSTIDVELVIKGRTNEFPVKPLGLLRENIKRAVRPGIFEKLFRTIEGGYYVPAKKFSLAALSAPYEKCLKSVPDRDIQNELKDALKAIRTQKTAALQTLREDGY